MSNKPLTPNTKNLLKKANTLEDSRQTISLLSSSEAKKASADFSSALNQATASLQLVVRDKLPELLKSTADPELLQALNRLADGTTDTIVEKFRNKDKVENSSAALLLSDIELLSKNFLSETSEQTTTMDRILDVLSTQVEDSRVSEKDRVALMKQTYNVLLQSSDITADLRSSIEKDIAHVRKVDDSTLLRFEKTLVDAKREIGSTQESKQKVDLQTLNDNLSRNFLSFEELANLLEKDQLRQKVQDNATQVSTGAGELQTGFTNALLNQFGVTGVLGEKLSGLINDKLGNIAGKPFQKVTGALEYQTAALKDKAEKFSSSAKDFFLDKPKKLAAGMAKQVTSRVERHTREFSDEQFTKMRESVIDTFDNVGGSISKTMRKVSKGASSSINKLGVVAIAAVSSTWATAKATTLAASSGLTSLIGSVGKGMLSLVSGAASSIAAFATTLGPIAGPLIAGAIAGAVGAALGTLANNGINYLVDKFTGGKNDTLGGYVYDSIHGDSEKNSSSDTRKKVLAIREKGLISRGYSKEEAAVLARSKDYTTTAKLTPDQYRVRDASSITKEATSSITKEATSAEVTKAQVNMQESAKAAQRVVSLPRPVQEVSQKTRSAARPMPSPPTKEVSRSSKVDDTGILLLNSMLYQ